MLVAKRARHEWLKMKKTNSSPHNTQTFIVDEVKGTNQNSKQKINLKTCNSSVWTLPIREKIAEKLFHKDEIMEDDFYYCSKPLFLLGKFCGLIPIQGLFSGSIEDVSCRWTNIGTIMTIIICVGTSTVSGISFVEFCVNLFGVRYGSGTTHRLILLSRGPLLLVQGAFMSTIFIIKSPGIVQLFKKWRVASNGLLFKMNHQKIRRKVTILTYIILIPSVIHMNLILFKSFGIWDTKSIRAINWRTNSIKTNMNETNTLELYFSRFWPNWTKIYPFNLIIVILLILLINSTHFAWLFADVLIIILSILLYGKFKTICHETALQITNQSSQSRLMLFKKTSITKIPRKNFWMEVRRDHLICMNLLWETEEILSPFIFVSYAMSIYFICIQVHQGITPASNNGSYEESALAVLTLVLLLARMIFMSLTAAKINEYAREINLSIQKCPNVLYTIELERLEHLISANNSIGLNGLGCFVVTKAFLLVLASVVFTFEIILLQTPNPDANKKISFCNLTNTG